VDSHAKTSTPAAQEYLKKALGAGRVLARAALKVGVKVGTAGALEAADLEKLAEAVSIEAEALTDKYLGEALTKQKEATGAIQGFREALEALPAALSHSTAGAYPLVVMIDELDRCRPQFALELLERIKHFFSVPNVHFILGVNTSQLENSIRAAYGGDMDARTYLQKFVSLTFPLVDQGRFQNERVIPKYIAYLQQQLKFEPQDRDVVNAASDLIQLVATARGLSLRHIERMMTNLALAVAFTKPNSLKPGPIVGGLCALRVVAPPLYAKAKEGMLTFEEVDEALFSAGTVEDASTRREWQRNWWRFALDKSAPEELIESFGRGLWNYDVDRERLVQVVANSIIDHLGP
jgi:tetratricopeptide (TPR) repeat protein